MSYYVVERPSRTRVARRVVLASIVAAVVIATATGFVLTRPLVVMVDGTRTVIRADTTVSDLRAQDAFKASPGDLISVRGDVARAGGGAPARVLRNGAATSDWQRLYRGDVLVSRAGGDRRESIEVTNVPIPFDTRVEGTGPVVDAVRDGEPGVRRVTRGSVSLIEMNGVDLVPPQDEILVRRSPKPGSKLVALTFDDGPWPESTAAILDVLGDNDVRATFFVLGQQVERFPGITYRIAEEGHLLGSHSLSHRRFSELKPAQVRREAVGGRSVIRGASGVDTPWIRPPYGAMNAAAYHELHRLDARVVMWDVDPRDWKRPGVPKIVGRVVNKVKPGSIVLLHDGGGNRSETITALPRIIRRLKAKGYVFVTVEELVEAGQVSKGSAAAALASHRTGD